MPLTNLSSHTMRLVRAGCSGVRLIGTGTVCKGDHAVNQSHAAISAIHTEWKHPNVGAVARRLDSLVAAACNLCRAANAAVPNPPRGGHTCAHCLIASTLPQQPLFPVLTSICDVLADPSTYGCGLVSVALHVLCALRSDRLREF